jgi:Ca-activated chloride channel homolog
MRRPICATVVGLGMWGSGLAVCVQSQVATFSTKLETVRVDVLATRNGRIVRGLGPADFEVRDNGVLQRVDFVSFEDLPLNIILALDSSDSVSGERLQHLRGAAGAVLDALTSADRAALITFSELVAVREGLTNDVARIRQALDALQPMGLTSLVDGAHAGIILAEPDGGVRNLVLVFSDGDDTSSWLLPRHVLEAARRSDATVYGVSVRGSRRADFLGDVAEVTGGAVIDVASTRGLTAAFVRILDEFRQRYVISYSPRGVARPGWHPLEVRIKGRRADVRARTGYFAGPDP